METGHRDFATHVVKNGKILYAFTSPLNAGHVEFAREHEKHGDGVKDVAFHVDDARKVYERAVSKGAKSVKEPEVMQDDNGIVIVATV